MFSSWLCLRRRQWVVYYTSIILRGQNDKNSSKFLNSIFLASGNDSDFGHDRAKLVILGLGPLGLSGELPPNPFV